jgi:large subunit ribosomal protein L13
MYMNKQTQKTTLAKSETFERKYVLIDATDQIVGRLASTVADILRGKHKPTYTPGVDAGEFVVVTNASKLKFSGNKMDDKIYHHPTGFIGGLKSIKAKDQLQKHPDRILSDAVWGMLPKGPLSRHLMKKLKIYAGAEHPHAAQKPTEIKIENIL